MKELTIGDLPMIFPLLKEALETYELPLGKADPDYVLSQIHYKMESNIGTIIVDNGDIPHAFVLGVIEHSAAWDGKLCVIPLFYVHPDFRSPGLFRELKGAIEAYGKRQECKELLSSSWIFRGLKNASDELWKAMGMEQQEIIYSKTL